ncbi:MAG: hypothetical protein FVQ84_20250 [Planctomycetes bacterium]|nr:hypothetical protein [Planctomycetota bacterium]
MINGRRIISAVICGLIVTAAVHADMVSVPEQDTGRLQSSSACNRVKIQCSNFSNPYNFPHVADLDSWSAGFLPQANTDVAQTSEVQQLQSFTNGPGSLNLCLSALIGLGLCSSAHFVKKMSFSFVPEWYHNGGPFQIGHSHAITPESLCSASVHCFIQPVCTVEGSFTQYRLGTIVSLWRKSQFTPAVIASRGPPLTS